MLIDTHSHIYDEVFDGDRDAVVARAREAGVGCILLPAVDGHSYGAMFETARRYAGYCFPMMGLHPTSVNDNPRYGDDLEKVARLLEAPPDGIRFCGVGEVGLDLYWSRDFADEQLEALRFQIELALRYGLPLVIHTRDAWDEMCGVLEEYRGQGIGTELLRAMMDALEREGVRQVSLSVQKGNPAVRLYRRVGFRIVRETEEEYIMVDRLGRASSGKEHAHAGQAGGRGGPIQPDRGQAGRAGDL